MEASRKCRYCDGQMGTRVCKACNRFSSWSNAALHEIGSVAALTAALGFVLSTCQVAAARAEASKAHLAQVAAEEARAETRQYALDQAKELERMAYNAALWSLSRHLFDADKANYGREREFLDLRLGGQRPAFEQSLDYWRDHDDEIRAILDTRSRIQRVEAIR